MREVASSSQASEEWAEEAPVEGTAGRHTAES